MSRGVATTPHPALISYPVQAAFGRVLPKTKLYEYSKANTRLKDLLVKQVEQIVWACKLAPETVNLAARPGVAEIQVFRLKLKAQDLHQDVLRCIDWAIPFPILFELAYADRLQVVAAYKRPPLSDENADASRWVVSDYFASDWLPAEVERVPMPVSLHMAGLYEQLLQRLIPLQKRPEESLDELVARVERARAKQRELDMVAARLDREKQFNRKVQINAKLRQIKTELEELNRSPLPGGAQKG